MMITFRVTTHSETWPRMDRFPYKLGLPSSLVATNARATLSIVEVPKQTRSANRSIITTPMKY